MFTGGFEDICPPGARSSADRADASVPREVWEIAVVVSRGSGTDVKDIAADVGKCAFVCVACE